MGFSQGLCVIKHVKPKPLWTIATLYSLWIDLIGLEPRHGLEFVKNSFDSLSSVQRIGCNRCIARHVKMEEIDRLQSARLTHRNLIIQKFVKSPYTLSSCMIVDQSDNI